MVASELGFLEEVGNSLVMFELCDSLSLLWVRYNARQVAALPQNYQLSLSCELVLLIHKLVMAIYCPARLEEDDYVRMMLRRQHKTLRQSGLRKAHERERIRHQSFAARVEREPMYSIYDRKKLYRAKRITRVLYCRWAREVELMRPIWDTWVRPENENPLTEGQLIKWF